eukprot:Skav234175  [mRNA]  locus=scaffold572:355170:357318:- [translate_table: standard]
MVQAWGRQFPQCSLVILGAGPPCQGVSGLNADRKGALRDRRSCLFSHVPRVRGLLQRCMPWAPVNSLMESVASMDEADRDTMSAAVETQPYECDAAGATWCHRPRLYWLTWDIVAMDGLVLDGHKVHLSGTQPLNEVIRAGWIKVDQASAFPTFTTSRPRSHAGRKPAGVKQCSLEELRRWHEDQFRFPPYQYRECHSLVNRRGELRLPDVQERELMLGFPLNYTENCLPKSDRKGVVHADTRLTLLGNTWSVPVVAVLLSQLFSLLGWIQPLTVQQILDTCRAGCHTLAQGRLVRLPLNMSRSPGSGNPEALPQRLGNLLSIKGEDILLSTPTTQLHKFHRLRATVPGRLWKWRVVAGWRWRHGDEHINALEMRAILTTLRWRLEHQHQYATRFIHLTDSLVCLHAVCRGRSSSRKLRRTMAKLNAMVLVANVQPDRAAQRRRLGTLRELTVQPATRRRYTLATRGFFDYLESAQVELPRQKSKLDGLLSDYIEYLWSSGAGRAQACDTVAGLQDLQPELRGLLQGSWRLLKTWSVNEVPNRAPPLPQHVVHAMVGWALFKGRNSFAVSLMVGFYCMLRTGEVLTLRSSHIMATRHDSQVIISLGFTKGGKRQGAAESVILGFEGAVQLVKQWKTVVSASTPLVPSSPKWRKLFAQCLTELKLDEYQFRPYIR